MTRSTHLTRTGAHGGGLSDTPTVPEPSPAGHRQTFAPLSSGQASLQLLFGLGVALTGLGVLALMGNAPGSSQ